jgi:hypothetical protein
MGIPNKIVKTLYALSRNKCAFPNCDQSLVSEDCKSLIGEICHIRGQKKGSARYDASITKSELIGLDNLIILCRNHHKVIDSDPLTYTVEYLIQMKQEHENSNQDPLRILETKLDEMKRIDSLNTVQDDIERNLHFDGYISLIIKFYNSSKEITLFLLQNAIIESNKVFKLKEIAGNKPEFPIIPGYMNKRISFFLPANETYLSSGFLTLRGKYYHKGCKKQLLVNKLQIE